ncbi:MAG: UDP-2,3-diacylglucosamine diphosphatase [Gammaproteobacteria bacterium]
MSVHHLNTLRYRSIFISDVHLGFRGCRAEFLLDFLRSTESEYLYLVGDIIDVWEMRNRLFWPQAHNNVIRTVLGKAKRGTKVIYIPGNHDEVLRDYAGMDFGNVAIRRDAIHETADGKRLLVLHGDEFDSVVQCSRLLAMLGNKTYDWLLYLNRWLNVFRRKLGFPYWSLASYLKHKVKNAMQFISDFEHAVAREVQKRNVHGVVCGHIHHAEITTHNGILYCNDGDWVESCTALIEKHDGGLELLNWTEQQSLMKSSHPLAGFNPEMPKAARQSVTLP